VFWRKVGECYNTIALGLADDLTNADGSKVFDFWQAQGAARQWAEKQRLIDEGMVRGGPYTVANAVQDYLDAVHAEKGPAAERRAKYIFRLRAGLLLSRRAWALRRPDCYAPRCRRPKSGNCGQRPNKPQPPKSEPESISSLK
jgi:hypothetical protein